MPILKNAFGKLIDAIRQFAGRNQGELRETATEIGRIFFQEVVSKQPIGERDSWDQSTTSSERQGHTAIRDGWGNGPEVTMSRNKAVMSLSSGSEHIQYFVWSLGGVRATKLGTSPHRIPLGTSMAKEQYGHPLAFWWKKESRSAVAPHWINHPGFTPEESFVEEAWGGVRDSATRLARAAGAKVAFGGLREFFR